MGFSHLTFNLCISHVLYIHPEYWYAHERMWWYDCRYVITSLSILGNVIIRQCSNAYAQNRWRYGICKLLASINTLKPRQNIRHFADDIFQSNFLNANVWILINISLKIVCSCPIDNIPTSFHIMAWCRPVDKPLLNQWWSVYRRIYTSVGLNELNIGSNYVSVPQSQLFIQGIP